MRDALRRTRWITFGVLVATGWTLLVALDVATAFQWTEWPPGQFVGPTAVGGIVGLVVLAALVGLLVTLYGELTEVEPAPQAWPPE
ncbi:MAG: hypothetical protein ABEJ05_09665 [Haloglomus sp.]